MNDMMKRKEFREKCGTETWEKDIFMKEKSWKLPVLADADDYRGTEIQKERTQEATVLMISDGWRRIRKIFRCRWMKILGKVVLI